MNRRKRTSSGRDLVFVPGQRGHFGECSTLSFRPETDSKFPEPEYRSVSRLQSLLDSNEGSKKRERLEEEPLDREVSWFPQNHHQSM